MFGRFLRWLFFGHRRYSSSDYHKHHRHHRYTSSAHHPHSRHGHHHYRHKHHTSISFFSS